MRGQRSKVGCWYVYSDGTNTSLLSPLSMLLVQRGRPVDVLYLIISTKPFKVSDPSFLHVVQPLYMMQPWGRSDSLLAVLIFHPGNQRCLSSSGRPTNFLDWHFIRGRAVQLYPYPAPLIVPAVFPRAFPLVPHEEISRPLVIVPCRIRMRLPSPKSINRKHKDVSK